MKFKYRVKGLVEKSFILRGAYFAVGANMDFYIPESELEFVKERCRIEELIDLEQKPVESPEPVLEENKTESENKPKGVKNGLQNKSTSIASKGKHKANI